MFRIVCAVGAVLTSMVKPVCLQEEFCQSTVNNPDCHSHDSTDSNRQPSPLVLRTYPNRSSDTHTLHDLDNFEVSCKKLIGKRFFNDIIMLQIRNAVFGHSNRDGGKVGGWVPGQQDS